jgi:hypothetical protein
MARVFACSLYGFFLPVFFSFDDYSFWSIIKPSKKNSWLSVPLRI